jgi:hypothetical protein
MEYFGDGRGVFVKTLVCKMVTSPTGRFFDRLSGT